MKRHDDIIVVVSPIDSELNRPCRFFLLFAYSQRQPPLFGMNLTKKERKDGVDSEETCIDLSLCLIHTHLFT